MKRLFYGDRLSEHKIIDTNGQLICLDVPIARTGSQKYLAKELGINDSDEVIDVDRPYEEVFAKETLASFENAPVTLEHPRKDVKVGDNYKQLAVGFTRNVRQGKLGDNDVILADLVIYDKDVIEKIQNKEMNEVSCGYDCNITDSSNGYCQTNIRGNHVAIVEAGRAGIAVIKDNAIEDMARMEASLVNAINWAKRYIERYGGKRDARPSVGDMDMIWSAAKSQYYLRDDEKSSFVKSMKRWLGNYADDYEPIGGYRDSAIYLVKHKNKKYFVKASNAKDAALKILNK